MSNNCEKHTQIESANPCTYIGNIPWTFYRLLATMGDGVVCSAFCGYLMTHSMNLCV